MGILAPGKVSADYRKARPLATSARGSATEKFLDAPRLAIFIDGPWPSPSVEEGFSTPSRSRLNSAEARHSATAPQSSYGSLISTSTRKESGDWGRHGVNTRWSVIGQSRPRP